MSFLGVGEWLVRREQLTPDKIGIVDVATGARLTYRTLNLRARALAALLAERYGIRQGDRVAMLAANSPEYLDAFFACALLGAIFVPLNWRLTPPELATILTDCEPRLLLHDAAYHQLAEAARGALPVSAQPPLLYAAGAFPGAHAELAARARPFACADGEEIALILYTSGTTGIPKGAMLSHRMLTWNAINTQVSWGLAETDITPTFAPFFHAGGLNVLTTPLYHCGGTVVLLPSAVPDVVLRAIAVEHCTIVFAVPTVFQSLMEHPTFATTDFSSVRFCVTGGSSCPLPLIERYAARGLVFRQGYGLTEVGVNCFSLAPEDAVRKAGSVGRPVFHSWARIVDDAGRDVAPGAVGELALAGPHVCSGYWRRPEATAEVFRDGWWHTGDLVTRDDEGYYAIVGRKKDMYISGGENVYPAEVEGLLATHPGIAEAAIIAQPDAKWGEVGVAVVVPRVPGSLGAEDVLAFCDGKLARYKLPRRVVFSDALPRNAMGKVIKADLRARYIAGVTPPPTPSQSSQPEGRQS
ncbi:MAG: Long-chain-fatty-acid--CoA ligase [Ktedonobacterales bacterium]|jgi:fatty-acyl-CoA synthase|nr:MAG: Long-chain-fatty-acid--CoA ligase [Ktedonobacterales bacterium]